MQKYVSKHAMRWHGVLGASVNHIVRQDIGRHAAPAHGIRIGEQVDPYSADNLYISSAKESGLPMNLDLPLFFVRT